jgi:hypothetical protein
VLPLQVDQFAHPQAMMEGNQHHGFVPVRVAVFPKSPADRLNLRWREMSPAPESIIGRARDFPRFGAFRFSKSSRN